VCSLAKQLTVFKWKYAISGFPVSQGSAEALDRWGGKTKHRLISYVLSNTSAENYRNRIGYMSRFLRHGVHLYEHTKLMHDKGRKKMACKNKYYTVLLLKNNTLTAWRTSSSGRFFWVWGTSANFNGFRVLASLLHRRRSTEVNQALHDVWPSSRLVHYVLYTFCGLL